MAKQRKQPQIEPFPTKQLEGEQKKSDGPVMWVKIPLKEDGQPDVAAIPNMRDEKKAKLRNLITSAEFLQKIGGEGGSAPKPQAETTSEFKTAEVLPPQVETPSAISPSDVVWVFDVYGYIVAFLVCQALKAPFDVVHEEIKFDDEQKELMAKPLAKVIERHVPPEWLFYAPEFQLAVMVAGATTAKVNSAKEAVAKLKKAETEKKPTPIDKTAHA